MTDGQKHAFEEKWEIDFSFGIKDLCRFRRQRVHAARFGWGCFSGLSRSKSRL